MEPIINVGRKIHRVGGMGPLEYGSNALKSTIRKVSVIEVYEIGPILDEESDRKYRITTGVDIFGRNYCCSYEGS